MKQSIHLILLSVVMLFYSCGEPEKCADYTMSGNSRANSSYKEYRANAMFTNTNQEAKFSIAFENVEDDCFMNSAIYFGNLIKKTNDTIFLISALSTTSIDQPTAIYYILDGDVTTLEKYVLLDSINTNNWLLIDNIKDDNTEMSGSFNMSFVTSNQKILSGERERTDDPNRPDTLHFFNGEFLAVRKE